MNLRRIPRPRSLNVRRDPSLLLQRRNFLNPHQIAPGAVQVRGRRPVAHVDSHGAIGVSHPWHRDVRGASPCGAGDGGVRYPGVEAVGEGADEGVLLGMGGGEEGEGRGVEQCG